MRTDTSSITSKMNQYASSLGILQHFVLAVAISFVASLVVTNPANAQVQPAVTLNLMPVTYPMEIDQGILSLDGCYVYTDTG